MPRDASGDAVPGSGGISSRKQLLHVNKSFLRGETVASRPSKVVLLARVFGSAYWAGLQCSIVVFLALLDVLFVVTHRKQWEVPVPVSSSSAGLDMFATAAPFVLLLLLDTAMQVFYENANVVDMQSSDIWYLDLVVDILTLFGYYVALSANTSRATDTSASGSHLFDEWTAWVTDSKRRSAAVTHLGLMCILLRICVSIYRYQCWQVTLRGSMKDKVQSSRNVRTLLFGVTCLAAVMFLAVLQVVSQSIVTGGWSGVLSGPRATVRTLSDISGDESFFNAASRSLRPEINPSSGGCHKFLSFEKDGVRVISEDYFEYLPTAAVGQMDAAPVHKVSVNLLDPSDFVLELHEGAMTVELVPVQCPFHDSMHVIKVSFVGVILLTTGVIYVLGNSGMLTPLYTLLSAIIAAGSTLNDEGMLNEVGMEDSREGISAEHAVARVVRAIRLLWKASLRGRAVVTRLLNEASTEQHDTSSLGLMAMFTDQGECAQVKVLEEAHQGTANIEAKQKPVFSSIALNRKGFLGLSPNLRLQAMVRKSRVRALRTASAQPKDSSRMTTTTHERNPSAHPQIAALSGSATKGNASNRKVSRIAQVFPTQLSSAPGRHGDNSAIEARDASSPACRSPAPLDPHTSNQMSASDASFSAHTGGGQSGMRSVQDMEKTLGTLEWDVLSLSDDAIKLSIVLMFDSVGLLIHDMATGGSWEASLQTGAMTEGLGSLTKGALQREYASTQDVMGQAGSNEPSRLSRVRKGSKASNTSEACGLISLSTLEAFIDQMQQSYKENPYHCWRHAVDVLHTTYVMINLAWDFIEEHLRAIDLFSLMVGALAHDMHHTGVSNLFLCRTEHALAIAYNDKSVQENMHAASLFRLCLEKPTCDVMEGLTQEERAEVRKTIIALILDTDMAKHFQHTGELEILSTKLKMRGSDPSASSAEGSPLDRDSVMRVMGAIIHMADIGHSLKPVRLHLEWSRRVLSEFFSESTQLRELGHTPLPFMDPLHCHVPTAQIDYLDFVVRPYLFALCEVIPALKPLLSALLSNYVLWADCIAAGRAGGDAPPSEDVLPTSEPEADVRPRAVSRMTSGGRQGGEGMGSRARSRMTSQGGEKMSEERKREMTAHLELYKGVIGDMGVPEPSKNATEKDYEDAIAKFRAKIGMKKLAWASNRRSSAQRP